MRIAPMAQALREEVPSLKKTYNDDINIIKNLTFNAHLTMDSIARINTSYNRITSLT